MDDKYQNKIYFVSNKGKCNFKCINLTDSTYFLLIFIHLCHYNNCHRSFTRANKIRLEIQKVIEFYYIIYTSKGSGCTDTSPDNKNLSNSVWHGNIYLAGTT